MVPACDGAGVDNERSDSTEQLTYEQLDEKSSAAATTAEQQQVRAHVQCLHEVMLLRMYGLRG